MFTNLDGSLLPSTAVESPPSDLQRGLFRWSRSVSNAVAPLAAAATCAAPASQYATCLRALHRALIHRGQKREQVGGPVLLQLYEYYSRVQKSTDKCLCSAMSTDSRVRKSTNKYLYSDLRTSSRLRTGA
jgi:hypothetical protein